MISVWIVLGIIIYIAIGGFVCGLMDDEEYFGLYITIWPLLACILIIVGIGELPRKLGSVIHDWWAYDRKKQ